MEKKHIIDAPGRSAHDVEEKPCNLRQLVLKPLEDVVNQSKLFFGGALLDNGDVALALDVTRIVHQMIAV